MLGESVRLAITIDDGKFDDLETTDIGDDCIENGVVPPEPGDKPVNQPTTGLDV